MSDLYDNLLKATDNTNDITNEKYGVITKLEGVYCSVKEDDTGLEHSNVPILNGASLELGDKVIIGFLNNSIYDVVCYGALDKTVHDNTKQDKLISGENIKTINNNSILGSGNLVIEGGGSSVDIVTEWETTTSDSKVASEKLTKDTLDTKVDKENGKGLSSNDFTDSYKSTIDNLKTVATTGSYTDLSNKPSIPTSSSDLSDGSDLVKKSSTSGLLKNDGNVDTTQYLSSLPSHNHDDRYYTESEIDTALNGKQATLISGTNLKTINNTSLLGSGNINIQGGGSVTVDSALSTTSENPVQNKVITGALNGKADSSSLSTVATSGSYNDLSNKPSIPTKTSDLTNDGADGTNVFVANNDSRLSDARTPTSHNQASSTITDSNTYTNIGNSSTNQESINGAIDTKLGTYTHDTGWQDMTFPSGFNHYGTVDWKAQYRRVGKIVAIRGAVKNTNAFTPNDTNGTTICTIGDTTCRPSKILQMVQQGSGMSRFLMRVSTDGTINIFRYGTTSASQVGANSMLNIYCTFLVD